MIEELPPVPEDSLFPDVSDFQRSGDIEEIGSIVVDNDGHLQDEHQLPGERVENDDDAAPLSDDEDIDPPSPDYHPTRQQLIDLKIAHDNSGHPTATDFARLLKLGNAKPELVRWVKKNFVCEECQANTRPRAKRPSAVPKSYRFNHVIGLDLLQTRNHDGVKQNWLNVLCWGTSLQQVKILPGNNEKTARNTWNTFVDTCASSELQMLL
jgi:hypothetical protein